METGRTEPSATNAGPAADPERGRPQRVPRSLLREVRREPTFRSLLLALLAARLARPAAERCRFDVECHPGVPYHRHVVWKAALHAGARLLPHDGRPPAAAPRRPRVQLFWPDMAAATLTTAAAPGDAPEGRPSPPETWWRAALNGAALDPSKRTVARVFAEAFGYALAVDPTRHRGPCVAKSDRRNGAHDGRVLECPVAEADPAVAYEVLVDNRAAADPGTVVDLRVPVLGGEIPFVYVKRRPLRARFANENTSVAVVAAGEVFSPAEAAGLRAFCRGMGLDLGELDVLRDAGSGLIYVVDVNMTAWGPPRPLRTAAAVRAVRAYAAALARLAGRRAAAADEPGRRPKDGA